METEQSKPRKVHKQTDFGLWGDTKLPLVYLSTFHLKTLPHSEHSDQIK